MFKKSLVTIAALASATAAMTSTAHAGWAWVGYQNDTSWAVYDYSAGRWNTVYTQNYVNGLRTQIGGLQVMVNDKNNLIANLKADVAAKQETINGLNEVISTMEAELGFANDQVVFLTGAREDAEAQLSNALDNLGSAYNELNGAEAEIARLNSELDTVSAELAIANAELAAQPEVPGAPAVPDSAEVSTLMETIANSSVGPLLSESVIDQFIRTGVVAGGTIEGITAYDAEAGAALQELRDIRVAQVEAGMTHDAYVGLDHANATNFEYNQVIDSSGVALDESGVSFTINGKSFSSTYVTEDGATLGKTFSVGESANDWVAGFEEGYNAGYDDGYADGFADGYAAGVSDSTN